MKTWLWSFEEDGGHDGMTDAVLIFYAETSEVADRPVMVEPVLIVDLAVFGQHQDGSYTPPDARDRVERLAKAIVDSLNEKQFYPLLGG